MKSLGGQLNYHRGSGTAFAGRGRYKARNFRRSSDRFTRVVAARVLMYTCLRPPYEFQTKMNLVENNTFRVFGLIYRVCPSHASSYVHKYVHVCVYTTPSAHTHGTGTLSLSAAQAVDLAWKFNRIVYASTLQLVPAKR